MQSPVASFSDAELAAGKVGTNALGMPLVASGQNAVVFLLETELGQRAIRCFLAPPHEGAVRYEALEAHLVDTAPRALTAARYLKEGISLSGQTWPVVVMPWVEGSPLNIAVEDMVGDGARLRALAVQWTEVVRSLQRARVAHGDLQHGNVLVKPNDSIALVDLDGVWVPEIRVGPPAEFGHPNYQHPQRSTQHWGQYVDSFPGALIELALTALAADESLDRFLHGENLLFMRSDLERPDDSEVWQAVCASPDPDVAVMAAHLRRCCAGPIADVLLPFDQLRDGSAADRTVHRSWKAASATPAQPQVSATAGGNWWEQSERPASALRSASEPPASLTPATVATASPTAGPTPAPATDAAAVHVSPLVRLGQNLAAAGLVGGVLAGVLAALVTGVVESAFHGSAGTAAFVFMIGLFVGGLLLSMQAFVGRNWSAAARRFAIGGGLGAAAALVAMPLADVAVRGLGPKDGREMPLGLDILMFVVVATLLGLAVGSIRSVKTAIGGMLAGAAGGAVGGLVFGATAAQWEGTMLHVRFLSAGTMLAVAVATGSIGWAVGMLVRMRRTASLTIIEGANSGMEIAVEGSRAVIGASAGCDLVLRDDAKVQAQHAIVWLDVSPPEVEPIGTVLRNGAELSGRTALGPGDVVMIGGSFIRIEFKEDV
ncbi:MAG: hypothetical protein H6513_09645 [Acidimicrobiaceae bacterium]|nr:hypothetical protein [Acidimicrobiaceae bacterium]